MQLCTLVKTNKQNNMQIELSELIAAFAGSKNVEHKHPMLGKRVLVRSNMAGVHVGTLKEKVGNSVFLTDSIRLWSWKAKQGIALSGAAMYGTTSSKIDAKVELVEITSYEEMIQVKDGVVYE